MKKHLIISSYLLGTEVVQISAEDPDDPEEGRNAQLVYSLQKNVIDEASGKPIFSVDSVSGRISTALCCLDREHTSRYMLQLAATDGGGLKGTYTLKISLDKFHIILNQYFYDCISVQQTS